MTAPELRSRLLKLQAGPAVAERMSVFFGGLGILVYLILCIVLPKGSPQIPTVRIAEERYARGEISATELERIRTDLQAAP